MCYRIYYISDNREVYRYMLLPDTRQEFHSLTSTTDPENSFSVQALFFSFPSLLDGCIQPISAFDKVPIALLALTDIGGALVG